MGPNKTNGNMFFSSKYYFDDFKTVCQEYTQKYDTIYFLTFAEVLQLLLLLCHTSAAILGLGLLTKL